MQKLTPEKEGIPCPDSGKGKAARALFEQGANCAQAVFVVFAEEMGLSRETALCLSSPLGGGMGRLREVCGAVSGMLMAAGLKYGYADLNDREAKKRTYRITQDLVGQFRRENGSIICRELLGPAGRDTSPEPTARTPEFYKKRPCPDLIERAAAILENYCPDFDGKE